MHLRYRYMGAGTSHYECLPPFGARPAAADPWRQFGSGEHSAQADEGTLPWMRTWSSAALAAASTVLPRDARRQRPNAPNAAESCSLPILRMSTARLFTA